VVTLQGVMTARGHTLLTRILETIVFILLNAKVSMQWNDSQQIF